MIFKKYHFLILLLLPVCLGNAQNFQGKVTDSLKQPMELVNVLAIPSDPQISITYSITNTKGEYKLSLNSKSDYEISVSFLGYKKSTFIKKSSSNDIEHNFILKEQDEVLGEVQINYKYQPIKVRKDTITYNMKNFLDGTENKLREALKKLPGVEVDRLGNVKVNGKKVDKLLVEGEYFFTGDTKLGVNNIPADAIVNIEVIDNFNDVAFLKGLSDSDKLVMNIKLKEGKKKFIFGDIEGGIGFEDRYSLNPTLFYYSPKTNVTSIVDINNVGEKAFSFEDYINFEGGISKIISEPNGYTDLFSSSFANSLLNEDFIFGKNEFGAINLSHKISSKIKINAYSLINQNKIETFTENTNIYLTENQTATFENRNVTARNTNFYTLNKIALKYIPSENDDVRYEAVIKTNETDGNKNLVSLTQIMTDNVTTEISNTSFEILQNFSYSKQFSQKHTSTINANFDFSNIKDNLDWKFSQPIFNTLIPLEGDEPFNLLHLEKKKKYTANLNIKHYWVLNNLNHIYPIFGVSIDNQHFKTEDFQEISTVINSFENAGFNNDITFNLLNSYFGFQYKTKINNVIIKPGIIYHYYGWDINQFSENQISTNKGQFLPELLIDWDINNSEKLTANYTLISQFKDASFYANRFNLRAFNNLFLGNENLQNTLKHQASLNYYKFSLFNGLFYNGSINYTNFINNVKNNTQLNDIDQINTAIYTSLPENSLSINGAFSKKIKKLKGTLSAGTGFLNSSQIVNSDITKYVSNNYSYSFKLETSFNKFPNIEIGLEQNFNRFSSDGFENKFTRTKPYGIMEYVFLKDFILKTDYSLTSYVNQNENEKNTFEIGNSSLFYRKEDSPWGFGIEINNIFNIEFKNQNSFDQYLITDTKTFIQPRTILFKIHFKI